MLRITYNISSFHRLHSAALHANIEDLGMTPASGLRSPTFHHKKKENSVLSLVKYQPKCQDMDSRSVELVKLVTIYSGTGVTGIICTSSSIVCGTCKPEFHSLYYLQMP